MPVSWMPKKRTIEDDIIEEEARLEALRSKPVIEPTEAEIPWQPPAITPLEGTAPSVSPQTWMPPTATPFQVPQAPTAPPTIPKPLEAPKEEPVEVPFWQRALQAFAAPFEWVEETIIKPGLSLAATGAGAIPDVRRKPAEDYWEWKKRSWEEFKAPGVDMNIPWSDEPVRIDLKGVLEFIPWLLIPGAGQVGTGARAARGIAGLVGKIAKPLGYAIEYSPWGLVEKTAGAAMRAGIKATGKTVEAVSGRLGRKVFGEIPVTPTPPIVKKLSSFFEEAVVPARKEFEKALPAGLRARQEKAAAEIWKLVDAGKIKPSEATALIRKSLGEVGGIRAKYAVTAKQVTKEEMEDLLGMVRKEAETNLDKLDLVESLQNTLLGVDLPEPHHIRAFAHIFGVDFAKSVGKFARLPVTTRGQILDALNLPRAVLASGDLSATFRQGLILSLTRPQDVPRAFWRQLKHFASEKLALEMDDTLRANPLYREAVGNGVEFTALRKGAKLFAKEEPFASNLAQRIPFVRRSERAFTGFLNEMRMSAYEAAHHAMMAQGATPAQFKLMGSFINIASGRGTLPANLDRYAPVLNTVLFSARYQMSTLQLPRQLGRMLLSGNPYMRKEAAKALITFVGGGSALLALIKNTGGKVEIDPRSGDFGKVVIGETRLDIWRGYVQYARFMAQMLTGERKSAYGNLNAVQRSEIATRFIQSKASPAMGLMVDLLKGETYMGEDLITSTKDVVRSARERMLPLAIQDVIDAMEMSGVSGLWTAAPATLGVGVLTYVNDFVRTKQKIAKEMGFETWDEIDPATQRRLENSNAELQAAYIEFDRQVMGTAWGDWRLAGKAIENILRENTDKAVAQYRETKDGYQFREKIGDAWTARRGGYAAREQMPQFEDIVKRLQTQNPAEALIGLGPEQMAIKIYNDALYGEDMYDEFGDYRFDEAEMRKQQLRSQLGNEMFDYVEQYRGIRYEEFPPEFQELTRAKQAMRPYWKVEEQAIELLGKPKTKYQQRRLDRLIQRIRKNLRRTNPEIAKYYEMFYVRV